MTLSGLELRQKACEAIGWTDIRRMDYCGSFVWCGFPPINAHIGRDPLPAIESDPAVSEPMFLEFCTKNDFGWILSPYFRTRQSDEPENFLCQVYRFGKDGFHIEERGSSPSEARARCIVIASAQEVAK